MVKPDVKHNYYQDLDLPTTASVDDVRKAYRKLALQYHPDRNAGREGECVPRFQAIQAANEILSDPTSKAKYDADRRKAGLYPASTFKPSVPTPGNPYAARSDFPPPPRRTQPGTWQRPQTSTAGATPTGADRFTHFPRPAGAAPQKNPATDRTQQFRAWQSMNTPKPQYSPQQPPQVPPREPPAANSARPGAAPTSSRPKMGRQDTKMPTEEQIRAGMRHGKTQMPQMPTQEELAQRQSAYQAFNSMNTGKPGVKTKKPPATPKRPGGFDPNAPGSDERAAPPSSHYVHRHKSEDYTAGGFPPPPPGPPPTSVPQSPTSPESAKAYGDPLRHFRSRNSNEDVPFAEGASRISTPYSSSGHGEKTQFSSENLSRSASTRDATRLSGGSTTSSARARSSDPAGRRRDDEKARANGSSGSRSKPTFIPGMYNDSSSANSTDDEDVTETAKGAESPGGVPPAFKDSKDRPIRKPAPPSRKFMGTASAFPDASGDGGTQTDSKQPSMQQRKKSNMYDPPLVEHNPFPSSFSRQQWVHNAFGSGRSTGGKPRKTSIPHWAIPSSVSPGGGQSLPADVNQSVQNDQDARAAIAGDTAGMPFCEGQSDQERQAFELFRSKLHGYYGDVEPLNQLNLSTFRSAVAIIRSGHSTGVRAVDDFLRGILAQHPAVEHGSPKKLADIALQSNRFSFPIDPDTFSTTSGKSRSAEEININFSPGTWQGTFNGSGTDYFTGSAQRPSASRRTTSSRHGRAATVESASARTSPLPPPPSRHSGSDTGSTYNSAHIDGQGFDKEAWQFKDSSWAWPPPPPHPPVSKAPNRKGSRTAAKPQTANGPNSGTARNPQVVNDDDNVIEVDRNGNPVNGSVNMDEDAMDIDSPPRHDQAASVDHAGEGHKVKEPRLYSVPPSAWRQSQAQQSQAPNDIQHHRHTSSASRRAEQKSDEANLNVNLEDLSRTEPLARHGNGLKNLADLSSTLPFDSKASNTIPTRSMEPQKRQLPKMPKVPEAPARLSKTTWQEYAQNFSKYVLLWHMFNSTMLKHFKAREEEAKDLISSGMDWLAASGDAVNGVGGFGSYCKAVKEDEQVRETWNVGSDNHLEGVKAFESIRDRVRERAGNGTLPEV